MVPATRGSRRAVTAATRASPSAHTPTRGALAFLKVEGTEAEGGKVTGLSFTAD